MGFLRRFFDSQAPRFQEGGSCEKLYPIYEAMDSFLYTPSTVTPGPSHVRDSLDMKRMMGMVLVALLPCIYMAFANTGYQANLVFHAEGVTMLEGWRGTILHGLGLQLDPTSTLSNLVHGGLYFLPVYIVCMAVGASWEVLFACMRGHEVNEGFLVTGILFPLTLPPTIPLWQVAIGVSFGVVIGKEVFGGTGKNFLNPALTGRAFLYFAHAGQLTGDNSIWNAAGSQLDAVSGATTLGELSAASPAGSALEAIHFDWLASFLGWTNGSLGETSTLACLAGALQLVITGIGSWRIMTAVFGGAMAFSALLWSIGSDTNPMFQMAPWEHLVVGGLAFGAIFMATDPVSASMTTTGKWIYGFLIGAMTILIRVLNPAYPEGIMLAILFGNVFAPLIDYFVVQSHIKKRMARYAP